jgi:hypothetical protein
MQAHRSGAIAGSTGYGVPVVTVSCFVSCVIYRSLLMGRTVSVYYRTESVSPFSLCLPLGVIDPPFRLLRDSGGLLRGT